MSARDNQVKELIRLRDDVQALLNQAIDQVKDGQFLDALDSIAVCKLLVSRNIIAIQARVVHMAMIHADDKEGEESGRERERKERAWDSSSRE